MVEINWQDQQLSIARLVLRGDDHDYYETALTDLAARLDLVVADDTAQPRAGDFWVGCHPRAGWGDSDPDLIGWASVVEVPLAVGLLNLRASRTVQEAGPFEVRFTPRLGWATA